MGWGVSFGEGLEGGSQFGGSSSGSFISPGDMAISLGTPASLKTRPRVKDVRHYKVHRVALMLACMSGS